MKKIFLSLMLTFLACATSMGAAWDPAIEWKTISSPHFNVHFPSEVEGHAMRLSVMAEELYPELTKRFGWEPDEPTEVVLSNNFDLANGMATALPRNYVQIFDCAPEMQSSIADYDDWLRMVFTHEYAHILALDYRRGYAKLFRNVFGRVDMPLGVYGLPIWFFSAPPNMFLPPWVNEGLAVNFETDVTKRGRKNSTFYQMIYRVDVDGGTIPPLDRLGGDFPEWPSYSTRYIYGTTMLELVDDLGEDKIGELIRRHGGRVPYAIDNPPFATTGMTYQSMYQKMVQNLRDKYAPINASIKEGGLTAPTLLTSEGGVADGPVWLDDGTLVYSFDDPYGPGRLLRLDLGDGSVSTIDHRAYPSGRATLAPDGYLYYTGLASHKPWAGATYYFDVYRIKPEGYFSSRLTDGARLRYLASTATPGRFVGVRMNGSDQQLVAFALTDEGATDEEALLSEPGARYDNPMVSPDGTKIAFSRKERNGTERLALYDMAQKSVKLLTPEGSRAGFPDWSPDGSRLMFSHDGDGVFNLYELELATGKITRKTNLLGGAFFPKYSPDGKRVAFSSYDSKGFQLAVIDAANLRADPATPSTSEQITPVSAADKTSQTLAKSEDYSALPKLAPTFWLPDALVDNGGLAPGAWTGGSDPLGLHSYFAAGFYSPELKRGYGMGFFAYDGTYPTIIASASKMPLLYADLFASQDYWEENRSAGIGLQQNFHGLLRSLTLGIGYQYEEVKRLSRIKEDWDGRAYLARLAFEGRQNFAYATAKYDSAFPYGSEPFVLVSEGGQVAGVTFRLREDYLGSERKSRETIASLDEYIKIPYANHTVLRIRAKGGLGSGDKTAQSLFQAGGAESEFPLRGYESGYLRGDRIGIATAELHAPLLSPFRGIWDWPVFLSRLSGVAFFDAGKSFNGPDENLRRAAGAEVRAYSVLGYFAPIIISVGFGHGFDEGGSDRGYIKISAGGQSLL